MKTIGFFLFSLLGLVSHAVFASQPILTITYQDQNITATYQDLLSRSDLTIVTQTPWTQGNTEFTGISAKALLAWIGVKKADLKVIALNNYWAKIPYSDIEKYNPVFAIQNNGKPMQIRDRGPVWSIYPLSSSNELNNEVLQSRMVWQINKIQILAKE